MWTTTTGTLGDAQTSYSQTDDANIKRIQAACWGYEGVAPGYLNELKCTATGANTVSVNTGGAVVDGKVYSNSAAVSVNIPSAAGGGNTRIDRIVIRADWANTDAAVTRIAGTDAASPTAPAITQTSGTTYDIPIAQVLVNTAGSCTVTDERAFASPPELALAVLGNAANTSVATWGAITCSTDGYALRRSGTALGFYQVGSDGIASNAIITAKIINGAVTEAKIDTGAVTEAKLGAGAVTNAKLGADAVDDTKVGNRVPQFYRRQGGNSSDWSVVGTTGYTPTTVRMQAGGYSASVGDNTVTFPQAFSNRPIVIIGTDQSNNSGAIYVKGGTLTSAGFTLTSHLATSVYWLAIGPE